MSPLPAGAIRLSGVGKRYTKYEDTPTLAYGLMRAWNRSRRSTLWAVDGVDLSVDPGEAVGLIGRNGSGKSTLLQMMCGVTAPTVGELRAGGRIAPLISVGVGFHPELTGRENVFVNGTILGLSRREIARRLDEIVAFSEIEEFIDTPVKFYSSGMYVRLGFAVAAHVDPQILLLDEILAVGDLAFQMKCFRYMTELQSQGTTIVVVTHNTAALERYCQRGVVIDSGKKIYEGPIREAISAYFTELGERSMQEEGVELYGLPLELDALEVLECTAESNGVDTRALEPGDHLTLRVKVRANEAVDAPFLAVGVISEGGVTVYGNQNVFSPYPPLVPGEVRDLECTLRLSLGGGIYSIRLTVGRGTPGVLDTPKRLAESAALLSVPHQLIIQVRRRPMTHGLADMEADFSASRTEALGS